MNIIPYVQVSGYHTRNKLTPRQQIIREAAIRIIVNTDWGSPYRYCLQSAGLTEERIDYWDNSSAGAHLSVCREALYNADIIMGTKENNGRGVVNDILALIGIGVLPSIPSKLVYADISNIVRGYANE